MNFEQLIQTFEQTHNYLQDRAVSTINQSLTLRNWLFGQYIVEYEQNGEDRAKYGEELLKNIAERMLSSNMKGLSDRSLRNCRQFYLVYPQINQVIAQLALPGTIWQMPSAKSEKFVTPTGYSGTEAGILLSRLSFSHLIELTRETDELKRVFYEQQAINGNWSVMELQRQMGSLLYERTGLSTNKEGLMIDVNKKAELLTPVGIMRDPYILNLSDCNPKKNILKVNLKMRL